MYTKVYTYINNVCVPTYIYTHTQIMGNYLMSGLSDTAPFHQLFPYLSLCDICICAQTYTSIRIYVWIYTYHMCVCVCACLCAFIST